MNTTNTLYNLAVERVQDSVEKLSNFFLNEKICFSF
jgi:hypothetical protein